MYTWMIFFLPFKSRWICKAKYNVLLKIATKPESFPVIVLSKSMSRDSVWSNEYIFFLILLFIIVLATIAVLFSLFIFYSFIFNLINTGLSCRLRLIKRLTWTSQVNTHTHTTTAGEQGRIEQKVQISKQRAKRE